MNGVVRFLLSNRLREAMVRIPLGILLSIRRIILNSGFTKRAKRRPGFTERNRGALGDYRRYTIDRDMLYSYMRVAYKYPPESIFGLKKFKFRNYNHYNFN